MVTLLITKWKSSRILSFDEELFFIFLLPPIIFNAGFQVKKKQFFRNFSTILLLGVFGTLVSFCIISAGSYFLLKKIGITSLKIQDYLAIGAIFSSTDSVSTLQVLNQEETPLLYSIVFGEGVVNDATSVVLFNAVQSLDLSNVNTMTAFELFAKFLYLFFTSTALGILVGLISAYSIKKLYIGRHSTNREVAIMLLLAYLSYMIAELLSLSGILTIFFCGIIMSHYTWHNVTERSRITTRHAFATMSFISETFIFLYVGMDALDIDKWKMSDASVGTTITASGTLFSLVMVGRAIFVFALANVSNCFTHRSNAKIDLTSQFVIWWAGLMRGAVTIALSYNQFSSSSTSKEYAFMITTTIIIVLFSTVVFGTVTKPLIKAALSYSTHGEDSIVSSLEDMRILFMEDCSSNNNDVANTNVKNSIGMLMRYPTSTIHYLWRKFDDRYMRPVFGGRGFASPSSLLPATDGDDV
ncbi:sodium/hydrogen exchanger 2-like [Zingiber officinale]|nr:sodium/hydrogen exchanger 2-like [Zingiber officinale]